MIMESLIGKADMGEHLPYLMLTGDRSVAALRRAGGSILNSKLRHREREIY